MPSLPTRMLFQLAIRDLDLAPGTVAVGLVLATYMRADGCAWPGVSSLAGGAGLSVRQARRALRDLETAGVLLVEHRPGRPSAYRATPDMGVRTTPDMGVRVPRTFATRTPDMGVRRSSEVAKPAGAPAPARARESANGPSTAAEAAAEVRRLLGDKRKGTRA